MNINSRSIDKLVRGDLGPYNLEEARPAFDRMLALYRDLATIDLTNVPFEMINVAANRAEALVTQLDRVQSFDSMKTANPVNDRRVLIDSIRDEYHLHWEPILRLVSFAAIRDRFVALSETASQTSAQLISLIETHKHASETASAEMKAILESVKSAAQEVAISRHAINFQAEAKEHSDAALRWLAASALLAAVTVAAASGFFWFYITHSIDLTPSQNIQLAIVKVIIFSLLLTATVTAGRIYKAHRHNYVINKHHRMR